MILGKKSQFSWRIFFNWNFSDNVLAKLSRLGVVNWDKSIRELEEGGSSGQTLLVINYSNYSKLCRMICLSVQVTTQTPPLRLGAFPFDLIWLILHFYWSFIAISRSRLRSYGPSKKPDSHAGHHQVLFSLIRILQSSAGWWWYIIFQPQWLSSSVF